MNTRMVPTRSRVARWAAVGIGSLRAAAGLASRASAEHSLLEQMTTGPTGGNGAVEPAFVGASADGSRVLFQTGESLVSGDSDTALDVYERSSGQTTLVSTGPTGGNGIAAACYVGASADGAPVFFTTLEAFRWRDDAGLDGQPLPGVLQRRYGRRGRRRHTLRRSGQRHARRRCRQRRDQLA
jgi:hypothetical protein